MAINTSTKASTLLFTLVAFAASITFASASNTGGSPAAELPTTLVSAPRFMDADVQIASRVQLIDAQDIVNSGATDLVQLLRSEANIHFRSTSGNSAQSEISMGGFGENSGQRVLILLDGHRLNTADLGQINWLSIPLGLVESVEVIQGGQSALYGNNAVGGVIRITTRRPTEELSGQAQATVGSFDSYNGRIVMSGRERSLGFSAHAEHDETDGYRDNSQYEADGAGFKLEWAPNDWLNTYGSVSGVSSNYGLPGSLTRVQVSNNATQTSNPLDSGDEDTLYARAGIGLCIGDLWTFAIDSGYTNREIFSDYVASFFTFDQQYDIFSISPSLTYQNENSTMVFGLDYYNDQVDAASAFSTSSYERETKAVFTSLQTALNATWSVTGSLRFENAENGGSNGGTKLDPLTEDQFAWSVGLIRFIENNARVYGSVRRFYRYPATDDIIISFPLPSFNPDIDPEWGHEAELGVDWAIDKLLFGGRFYYQWMNDEIIYDPSIGLFGATNNINKTQRMGVDLTADYAVTETIGLSLNYSWIDAKIASGLFDGSSVPLVPAHKLRLQVKYHPSAAFTVSVGANYTDNVIIGGDFANNNPELDDYVLFDLNLRYAVNENLELFATAENLFDAEYISTAFGLNALYPAAGRSVKLGVTWKF